MLKRFSLWITLVLWLVSFCLAVVWLSGGKSPQLGKQTVGGKRIAVIEVFGALTYEGDTSGIVGFSRGGVLAWLEELERAADDPTTVAIVLRVNSPGGTVGATQELHAAIQRVRERGKVVVASFGDMAASGGYYIATACDAIVSLPGTLTGSIGVIMQGFQYHQLLQKIGVKASVVKSGKNKDIFAGYREMTPEEESILFSVVSNTYEQFVEAVMKGRNLSRQQVEPLSDGRIFTGEQALQAKLVDSLGTFEDAVELARKLAHVPSSTPVYFPAEEELNWKKLFKRLSVQAKPGSLVSGLPNLPSAGLWYYTILE
ncbi:MAG: signal peptide peptidase SppA [Brevinematales bacterium]|nr:signal peptide peptidase SppA [Brevinematales bacterium]